MSNESNCSAYGAEEGQLHKLGCDMKRCPFCGQQLFCCDCCYDELGYGIEPVHREPFSKEDNRKWLAILDKRGRIPHLRIRHDFCMFCGRPWRIRVKVSDEEWKKFVVPALQDATICRPCFDKLGRLFPDGWRKARPYSEVEKSK